MAWVLFAQQNTIKTAFRFSIINFYFVTAFYSLYDICMARQMIKTTILRYCMTVWAAPCPDGTRIYLKPTASSEGAPLWVSKDAHTLSWFREAGPMYCPQYHRGYVSPASRNCCGEGLSFVPTAALLRSLQWVSDSRSRFAEPCCLWFLSLHCLP